MRHLLGFSIIMNFLVGCGDDANFNVGQKEERLQVSEAQPQLNILFIIDSSGSMNSALSKLGERFKELISSLPDIEWQMAVIRANGQGDFLPFMTGTVGDCSSATITDQFILGHDVESSQLETMFSLTVQCAGSGGGDGQAGVQAFADALNQNNSSTLHQKFFRPDSHLAVVIISDEDQTPRNNQVLLTPNEVLGLVDLWGNNQLSFSWHSIVTIDNACASGNSRTVGTSYIELSNLSGGVVGDICADSFADIMTSIGQDMRTTTRSVEIGCTPINSLLTVEFGEGIQPIGYRLEGQTVIFDQYLEPGAYELIYNCTGTAFE